MLLQPRKDNHNWKWCKKKRYWNANISETRITHQKILDCLKRIRNKEIKRAKIIVIKFAGKVLNIVRSKWEKKLKKEKMFLVTIYRLTINVVPKSVLSFVQKTGLWLLAQIIYLQSLVKNLRQILYIQGNIISKEKTTIYLQRRRKSIHWLCLGKTKHLPFNIWYHRMQKKVEKALKNIQKVSQKIR